MNRRQAWGLGAAGVVAAAAGAGWSAWRHSLKAPDDAAEQALWALRLQRPGGGELGLAAHRGRPLVVNFWATWCPPCVKEMPELDRFSRTFAGQGWQVVGVAIDSEAPVQAFLQKTPVSFPIGLAGTGGISLVRTLGNAEGGLPFTVVADARGRIVQRHLGATHFEQLSGWANGQT